MKASCPTLFLAFALGACATSGAVESRRSDPNPGPLLWTVRHPDLNEPLGFIFASLHIDTVDAPPFDAAVERAFRASNLLVLEADPRVRSNAPAQSGEMDWAATLSPEKRDLLQRASDELAVPLERLTALPPWHAFLILSAANLETSGLLPSRAFEWHFIHQAAGRDLPIAPLETRAEQNALFEGLSDEHQKDLLLSLAAGLEEGRKEVDVLLDAYNASDQKRLSALIHGDHGPAQAALHDRIFEGRNSRLATRLDTFLNTKDKPFIILGVGHLVGEGNVLSALRKSGLILEQAVSEGPARQPRLPLAAMPAEPGQALPEIQIDLPPGVAERETVKQRGFEVERISGDVGSMRMIFTTTLIPRAVLVDQLFAEVERGIARGTGLTQRSAHSSRWADRQARRHSFADASNYYAGLITFAHGQVFTLAVVATPETQQAADALLDEVARSLAFRKAE